MPRFPLNEWRAEQLRLTVFTMPDAALRRPEWWAEITGAQPDESNTNPKKGSGLVSGDHEPGKLLLKWEPDRIDLVLAAKDIDLETLMMQPEFATLGPAPEMFDLFAPIAEQWLARPDAPAIQRIAFGAVFLHPEPNRQSGYLQLAHYVPVQLDPESSDFLYQINLPAVASTTNIPGLTLNRLSKWMVATFRFLPVRFTGVGLSPAQTNPSAHYATRLELDINTAPTFAQQIPAARLIDVFRELVAAGRTIATNGVRADQ
jgi:hypothetical protein